MKVSFFLPALLALGTALIVPSSDKLLSIREDKKKSEFTTENIDDDPDIKQDVTGAKIPKSLMLRGVGPEEADKRLFDWDQSCSDAEDRKRIVEAWRHVIELSKETATHLEKLFNSLETPPTGRINKANQKRIFEQDPAFAQMFKGNDNRIEAVKDAFDVIVSQASKPHDQRGSEFGALRFICDKAGIVKNRAGDPYCGSGETEAQAITQAPWDSSITDEDIPKDKRQDYMEHKYNFEKASSIIFCPPFFDNIKFPSAALLAGFPGGITLDQGDAYERILLHEMLHLSWTKDLDPGPKKDFIGFENCADFTAKYPWTAFSKLPDNYAWYALYTMYNKGCSRDAWPQHIKKPVSAPK